MAPSEADDSEMGQLRLAMQGDRDAVTEIVRRYLPRVYGLCLRLLRARELAEEATQETFVRALRALPRLRSPESFASWILRIAANTAKEVRRKRPKGLPVDPDTPAATEADGGKQDARQKAVEAAVSRLDEEERAVFLLHTVEGVRLEDLARESQISVAAMKSRMHRIRERVREAAHAQLQLQGDMP